MSTYLLLAAIIVLAAACVPLWQIWRYLHRKDIPDDQPLGEEGAKYLSHRLTAISICAIIEAALLIAQAFLRFMESL